MEALGHKAGHLVTPADQAPLGDLERKARLAGDERREIFRGVGSIDALLLDEAILQLIDRRRLG